MGCDPVSFKSCFWTYLILDGVLLLRFIEGHAGAIVARDLCSKLFKDCKWQDLAVEN
jgi:hypothetical protein